MAIMVLVTKFKNGWCFETKGMWYRVVEDKQSDSAVETGMEKLKVKQNEFLKDINKNREINYLFNHKSRYNNENDLEIFRILPEGENSLHESIQHLSNYTNRNHIFIDPTPS